MSLIPDMGDYSLTAAGLPMLLTSIGILLLGVVTAIRERFSPIARTFFLLNVAVALWLFSFAWMLWANVETRGFFWARLGFLGISFIPAALYHFSLTLHGLARGRAVRITTAWATGGVFALLFITTDWLIPGLYLYSWGYYPRYDYRILPFLLYFFLTIAASLRQFFGGISSRMSSVERGRIRLLLLAMLFGTIGVIDFLPSLGVKVYPVGFLGIAIYLGLAWLAIRRYHLGEMAPGFAASEILSTMQGAVLVLDLEQRVRFANRATFDLLKYTPSELLGLPISDVVGDQWTDPGAGPVHRWKFRERGMRWRRSDGTLVSVNVSGSVVNEWDRHPAGIVLTAVDVSDRAMSELRLVESERRYRELVQRSPDLIASHRDGTIAFINDTGVHLLGADSADQIVGRSILDFTHPSGGTIAAERMRRVLDGEPIDRLQERLQRTDGSILEVELSALPYQIGSSDPAVLLIARDISERRRAESELKLTLSLVKSTLESTGDGILVVDRLGKIVSFNQRFARMWGIDPELLESGNDDAAIAAVLHQVKNPEEFQAKIRDLYNDPESESRDIIEFRDGRLFERFSTPQWLDGIPVGRAWSFRDVTEAKRSEETLARRDRILEAVAFASEGFLRSSSWKGNIDDVLGRFGNATGVSRVRILQMIGDALVPAAEWRNGRDSLVLLPEYVPDSLKLAAGEVVQLVIPPAEELSGCSIVLVPIVPEGKLWGAMEWADCDVDRAWFMAEVEALRAAAGALAATVQREATAAALAESERRYRLLFERNLAGVYRNSIDGRVLDCNEACARIFGYSSPEELMGHSARKVYFDPGERDRLFRDLRERGTIVNREVRYRRKDGSAVWVLETISLVEGSGDEEPFVQGTIVDISDRKEAERQIEYQAYHDALTDLPNRLLLLDRVSMAIAQAGRSGKGIGVMFLDLDHFKFINDTLGHSVGDMLLRAVARRLTDSLRGEDTVARIGGDEFTILLGDLGSPEDASTVAQKILEAVARPVRVEGHELFVTTSIGIAIYPGDGREAETLLKNADSAMYRAKELGRNNYELCTPELNARARERLTMENDLRRAIDRQELVVHFQPQVNLASGKITAVEALIRWKHPEKGMILPGEFIAIAEDSRLIFPIGDFVFLEACRQIKKIRSSGHPSLRVAVNLSARQFQQRDLPGQLRRVLEETRLEPHAVDIEITERIAMQNTEWSLGVLNELKNLGVGIVLDDFGTGYSSLAYLRRFPIDGLKIDQSFVRELGRHSSDRAIVSAVITMAKGLGMRIVAEGVETEEQRRFLNERECDELQGFLFSPAVPAAELLALLPLAPDELMGGLSNRLPS
ncbi:MAG TPA: EAL domain-containing protein [Thermoanaerobaculia bacterium]|nr:EAL domain-containing protein [Thermoanaerobaculia bacterium]